MTLHLIMAWHILGRPCAGRIDSKQSGAVAFDPNQIRVPAAVRDRPPAPQEALGAIQPPPLSPDAS